MSILQTRRRASSLAGGMPYGAVLPYAGSTAPAGWLLCFGQNVNRVTYSALFAVIATTYGVGDGSTTFGIPDLRGRSPFGKDDMGGSGAGRLTMSVVGGIIGTTLGASGGEQAHQLTSPTELPGHSHPAFNPGSVTNSGGAQPVPLATGSITTGVVGSNGLHNTVPPGIVLNYIIFAGA